MHYSIGLLIDAVVPLGREDVLLGEAVVENTEAAADYGLGALETF